MTRRETLASLELLLEYARDELRAVGLPAAARLAGDAMAIVREELKSAGPPEELRLPERLPPVRKPHLVFTRRTGDGR
jgi:hypothetical protein